MVYFARELLRAESGRSGADAIDEEYLSTEQDEEGQEEEEQANEEQGNELREESEWEEEESLTFLTAPMPLRRVTSELSVWTLQFTFLLSPSPTPYPLPTCVYPRPSPTLRKRECACNAWRLNPSKSSECAMRPSAASACKKPASISFVASSVQLHKRKYHDASI